MLELVVVVVVHWLPLTLRKDSVPRQLGAYNCGARHMHQPWVLLLTFVARALFATDIVATY